MSSLNVTNVTLTNLNGKTPYDKESDAGRAKAFLKYYEATSTTDKSWNVSSVTDRGTGRITKNFTNAFIDSHHVPSGIGGYDFTSSNGTGIQVDTNSVVNSATASYFSFYSTSNTAHSNSGRYHVVSHGDLA